MAEPPEVVVSARGAREDYRVLRKYKDKRLSFTDCTSLALIASRRLDAAFAFDDDFAAVGVRVLP